MHARGVAPIHLEILVSNTGAYVVDRSGGQTWCDGQPVTESTLLPYGRVVRFVLGTAGALADVQSHVETASAAGDKRDRPPRLKTAELNASEVSTREQQALARGGTQMRIGKNPLAGMVADDVPIQRGPGGSAAITLVIGGLREHHLLLPDQAATIGRGRRNLIRVPESLEEISGEHAKLTWENGWLVLEDVGINGTHLDGRRVRRAIVTPGSAHHVSLAGGVALLRVEIRPARRTATTSGAGVQEAAATAIPKGSKISVAIDSIMKAETMASLDQIVEITSSWPIGERDTIAEIVRARRTMLTRTATSASTARASLLLCCFLWGTGFRSLYLSPRIGTPVAGSRRVCSLDELRAELSNPHTRRISMGQLEDLLRGRFLECWLRFALDRSDLSDFAAEIRQDHRDAKAERWCRIARIA